MSNDTITKEDIKKLKKETKEQIKKEKKKHKIVNRIKRVICYWKVTRNIDDSSLVQKIFNILFVHYKFERLYVRMANNKVLKSIKKFNKNHGVKILLASLFVIIAICVIGVEGDGYNFCKNVVNKVFTPLEKKEILKNFFDTNSLINAKVELCNWWKKRALEAPYALIVWMVVVVLAKLISLTGKFLKSRFRKSKEFYRQTVVNNSEFRGRLFDYLEEDKTSRCLIITGEWGSGKTYQINEFFKEYQKYNSMKKYTVSCFAVESREQLATLLKEEMEAKDDSVKKQIVDLIGKVPTVGSYLASLYETVYSFNFLEEKDVLILEDVERITFSLRQDEFISDELKQSYKDSLSERNQRISMIAGYVNDLLERYGKKVILVCNRKDIDEVVFNDVFYSKLASEVINVPDQFNEIFDTIIMNNSHRCSETVLGTMKVLFGINDDITTKPLYFCVSGMFSDSYIKNIRNIEKVVIDSIIFLGLLEKLYGNELPKKLTEHQTRERINDYILSFAFYHVMAEHHVKLQKNRENVSYLELFIEDENIRNCKLLNKLCINAPQNRLFVGSGPVERVISETYSNGQIDLRKYDMSANERRIVECWEDAFDQRLVSVYSYEHIKYYFYNYVRTYYLNKNWLNILGEIPKLSSSNTDKNFAQNVPKLLKDFLLCTRLMDNEGAREFAGFAHNLKEWFDPDLSGPLLYKINEEEKKKYLDLLNNYILNESKKAFMKAQEQILEQKKAETSDEAKDDANDGANDEANNDLTEDLTVQIESKNDLTEDFTAQIESKNALSESLKTEKEFENATPVLVEAVFGTQVDSEENEVTADSEVSAKNEE